MVKLRGLGFMLAAALFALPLGASAQLTPLPSARVAELRAQEGQRAAEAVDAFLADRSEHGLGADGDLVLLSVHTDAFGQTHAHVEQRYKGLPVFGGMGILHVDPRGRQLPPTTEGIVRGIELVIDGSVTREEAIGIAREALRVHSTSGLASTAREVVFPIWRQLSRGGEGSLRALNAIDMEKIVVDHRHAWHVELRIDNTTSGIVHRDFIVDANDGSILMEWDSLQTNEAVGVGNSQYSGIVALDTWYDSLDGLYSLTDFTRAIPGWPLQTVHNAGYEDLALPGFGFYDSDNVWGDGTNYAGGAFDGPNGQTAAVDAHYGMQVSWDYLQTIHGRWGIDGQGSPVSSVVHIGNLYDNAFWWGGCDCMAFGNGSFPVNPNGFTSMAALDVVGHEFGHGLTGKTARLVYAGESGGLNESSSDILGQLIEFWHEGGMGSAIGGQGGDWRIGQDLRATPLRYMHKPSLDGMSADAWYPGIGNIDVHYSSGPMNRAFYFLAEGADPVATASEVSSPFLPAGMVGIGKDDAAAIWFRALTVYLYASADYVAARTAWLKAAADLFGMASSEYLAVMDAFAAINVGYSALTFDDFQSPSISLSASSAAGEVELVASASDNVGVRSVEFFVGGLSLGTLFAPPYVLELDLRAWQNGLYQAHAVAIDLAGNRTASEPVLVQVSNPWSQLFVNPEFTDGVQGWGSGQPEWDDDGNRIMKIGGLGIVSSQMLAQLVTIPSSATAAAMQFRFAMVTEEAPGAPKDFLHVNVWDSQGTLLTTLHSFSNADVPGMWRQASFDLSAFIGQTVRVGVATQEDLGAPTAFYLDDFFLYVSDVPDTVAPKAVGDLFEDDDFIYFGVDFYDEGFVSAEYFINDVSQGALAPALGVALVRSSLGNGSYKFHAVVTDGGGNQTTTEAIYINLDDLKTQLIENPGFEDLSPGGLAHWQVQGSGSTFYTDGYWAHSGENFLIFWSVVAPQQTTVYQTVSIPGGNTSAILRFWLQILSGLAGSPMNSLHVEVRSSTGIVLETLRSFDDGDAGGWREVVLDLSSYIGQTIQVAFRSDIVDGSGSTQIFVDDVSLIATPTPDGEPPHVEASVRSAVDGLVLMGTASDNNLVEEMRFYMDGALVHTVPYPDRSEEFSFTATLAAGPHQLKVEAEDAAGNIGWSLFDFEVMGAGQVDVQSPVVALSLDGPVGDPWIVAAASDDTGVMVVEFYVNDVLASRQLSSPYEVSVSSLGLGEALHEIRALAWDAFGKMGEDTLWLDLRPISVDPESAVVAVGESLAFTASSADPQLTVQWSVAEGPVCGDVDSGGVYTAPDAPAICHVVAAAGGSNAVAEVRVFTADLVSDGIVDGADMGVLAAAWGSTPDSGAWNPAADLDGDQVVDDQDVILFLDQFGRRP